MRNVFIPVVYVSSLLANWANAATVTVPSGTRIFGELQETVTSDEEEFEVGQFVRGSVWRSVVVDGQVAIPAGAEMTLQVSEIQKRRAFGRGGNVELRAVSVIAIDGTEIFLDGGYDKKGRNRVALSATLFALVAWPTAFIKGKEAVLPPGTVFDASIPANTNVTVDDARPRTIRLNSVSDLSVEILYDEMDEDSKDLPIQVTLCDRSWSDPFQVSAVNDLELEKPIEIDDVERNESNGCQAAHGMIDLKDLAKHFVKGINRFTVSVGGETAEVILDVEM